MNRYKMMLINSLIMVSFLVPVFLLNTESVMAINWPWTDTTAETVAFLQKYSEWLKYGGLLTVILTTIQWGLVKIVYILVSEIENLIPESFTILDFLQDAGLKGLTSAIINDLVVALMIITLIFLGIKMIIGKEPPKFKNIFTNIIISSVLIVGLPTLMSTLQEMSIGFYNSSQTNTNNEGVTSLSWSLIQNNTADLVYVANNGFDLISEGSTEPKNALTPEVFKSVELSELITPEVIADLNGEEIENLNYYLTNDGAGDFTATKIKGNKMSFFSDSFEAGYIRYPAKFLPIIVGMIGLLVAYVFALFVLITTFIEIGIKQIVGYFIFATDLESGQKTKLVIQDILNAYMLIAFTGLSFQIYTLFLTYLGTADVNFLIYIIGIVSATFVLIKGSTTIMRYFGVDVGLKEGFGQLAGAYALARSTGMLLNKGKNKPKNSNKEGQESLNKINSGENPSVNESTKNSKMKKSINSLGKGIGYSKEMGVSGMASDGLEKMKNSMTNPIKKSVESAESIGNEFNNGMSEGKALASQKRGEHSSEKNQEPGSLLKSSVSGSHLETDSNSKATKDALKPNLSSLNSQNVSSTNSIDDRLRQSVTQDVKPTNNVDGSLRQSVTQDVKPTNSVDGSLRQNATQDVKPINSVDGSLRQTATQDAKPINSVDGQLRQSITQDTKPTNSVDGSLRQSGLQENKKNVSMPQKITQQIISDVQSTKRQSLGEMKQKVIQTVETNSVGTKDVKQRVVQQLEQSDIATPSQAIQNIERRVKVANLPTEAKDIVQKVIQESSKMNITGESITQKVVQELKTANFGSKEEFKQKIIQDIEKSPTATTKQVKENIRKIIENVEVDKTSIFDKQSKQENPKFEGNNSKRFDFIKGV